MPMPSKFTEPVRTKVLQALQVGASRRTAADVAGIGEGTLRRWLERGRSSSEDSTSGYRKFYDAVQEAEAHPKVRALGIVYDAMADKPELAKWYLERREHGFAPPVPDAPAGPSGPVLIQLSFADGAPVPPRSTAIEVGTVAQDEATPETTGRLPAPTGAA